MLPCRLSDVALRGQGVVLQALEALAVGQIKDEFAISA